MNSLRFACLGLRPKISSPLQLYPLANFTSVNQAKKAKKMSKPEYLYGVNPIFAALKAERRDFQKLYLNVAEKGEKKSSARIQAIAKLAKEAGIESKYMHRVKLDKFTSGRQH